MSVGLLVQTTEPILMEFDTGKNEWFFLSVCYQILCDN